ncbi:uncharacterized protein J4E88_010953 [Alternaria novae-zelandiae]|uniref:uncharacterized protein n=1 Tax=Alternaria novae-zelandiae TaxID=430562 RepID=UPI0020C371DD|nr:uncharacterized protein J4E88_010953 [Alternaria novae-zelandiae]KAI4661505.1 hypothetical protein J4E88_010953 [Alternaria novae-zelandiae]
MSMAESYLEPLRHLTKNGFDDARLLLLQGLSREQRSALVREGMEHFTTDEASVQLCLSMLDSLQQPQERATSELYVESNDSRQPSNMQVAPTPTLAAHVPPTFGIALPRRQTKRKATENADPSNDRVHKAPALNATGNGVSSLSNGDEDDDEDWEGTTARLDNALRDDAPAVANADINVIDIRSTTLDIPVLKIGAMVPSLNGRERWQPLNYLDDNIGTDIHAKFFAHFAYKEAKRAAYSAVATSVAEGYSLRGVCINVAVWQKEGDLSNSQRPDRNDGRACDTCIRTKRLCVRASWEWPVGSKLSVMSLPDTYRQGKALGSIDAWVNGG